MLEKSLDPSARDFNYVQLDGKGSTANAILNEAQSLPVFADRRLVVVRNAEAIPAAELNQLVGYLRDPSPTTCLAIVAGKVDSRRTFFQELVRHHPTVECHPLPEGQLPNWIRKHAQSLGYTLSEEAATFLTEQIGSDLFKLHNEIIKAGLIGEDRKEITRKDAQQVCGAGGHWSIPDLLEAIGERRTETALGILKDIIESGVAPLLILGALARQFRQILKVRQLLLTDIPETMIQTKLNIWRSIWPKVLRQAKAYGMEDLLFAIRRLAETDAGVKGATMTNPLLMELLVMDLCTGEKGGLRRFLGREDLVYLERQA